MITRRQIGLATVLIGGGAMGLFSTGSKSKSDETFAVNLPDEEWRRRLTPEQYRVLRGHGTERAGTSPLDREKRAGTFLCAACDQALFESRT